MTAPFIDYLLSDEQASAIATEQMLSEFGVDERLDGLAEFAFHVGTRRRGGFAAGKRT